SMCLSNAPEQQIKDTLGWKLAEHAAPAKSDSKTKGSKSKTASKSKTETKAKATPAPRPVVWSHWAGNGANKALRLICYTHLGLTEDAENLAVSILQSRNGRG